MKSGKVKFGAHQGKSDTDKVTNSGTQLNHQIAFEINMAGPQHFGGATRLASKAFSLMLARKALKGWKVTLKPGEVDLTAASEQNITFNDYELL